MHYIQRVLISWKLLMLDFCCDICNFYKKYKFVFVATALLLLVTFGYEIFNFSLSVDEEREITNAIGTDFDYATLPLLEGRYGLYLFKQLTDIKGIFTPGIETLFACLLLFASAIIWELNFVKLQGRLSIKKWSLVFFSGIYFSLPFIVTNYMCYATYNAALCFATLCLSLATYIIITYLKKRRITILVPAIFLTTIAISIYETFANYFIVSSCIFTFLWAIHHKQITLKKWLINIYPYITVFLSGLLFYLLIRKIIGTNGYTEQFVLWTNGSNRSEVFYKLYNDILDLFRLNTLPGASLLGITTIVFLMFLILSITRYIGFKRFLIPLLGICVIISPFLLSIITGLRMPYRTLMSMMLFEGFIWLIILNYFSFRISIKTVLVIICTVIMWKQMVWVNRIFYGGNLCSQLDIEMGSQIGNEIIRITNENTPENPVVFIGRYQHRSPNIIRIDAVGQSIFFRPRSEYKVFFMNYLGFPFKHASEDQKTKAEELSKDLPIWPKDGSVVEFSDFIVVRLS